jgi:hypothetical protein
MHGHLLDYRWPGICLGPQVAVTRAKEMGEEKNKNTPVEASAPRMIVCAYRHAQTIIQNIQAPNLAPEKC